MAIESGILLKNHVSCNFVLKYHMKISLWHFTKTLNQFFYLSRKDENLEICIVIWFAQSNESKQFWGIFIGKHFNKWYNLIFIWLSPAVKQLLVKLWILNFHTLLIFSALEIKKLSLVGQTLWRFDIILHVLLIHLVFHLILL